MGKNSSAPAAPDPTATSNAQYQMNTATARTQKRLNSDNEVNPYYSVNYTYNGDPNRNVDGSPKNSSNASSAADAPARSARSANSNSNATANYVQQMKPNGEIEMVPADQANSSSSNSNSSASDGSPTGEQEYYNQDRYTRTVTLNPEEQKILDATRGVRLKGANMASGQLDRVDKALGQQVTYDGLPSQVGNVDYSKLQAVDPNFKRGNITNSIADAGAINRNIADAGAIQRGYNTTDQATTFGNTAGGIQYGIDDAGPIQRSLDVNGQWSFDNVGGPQRSVGGQDYGTQQQAVADSIYNQAKSRLDPQFQQQEQELIQSLADRGIPEGSDLYNKELDRFARARNDAYTSAQNAAQQGSLNTLSTLGGLDLSRFGAENQAQGQAFNQTAAQRAALFDEALKSGQFGNQAQAMAFSQNAAQQAANNSAQNQDFSQLLSRANFGNNAIGANNQTAAQKAAFANAAQAQQYSQNANDAQFANQAQAQQYSQNANNAQFANQAQQQDYAQQMQQQQLAAQLRQMGLNEQQVNAALQNQARATGYQERQNVRRQSIDDMNSIVQALGGIG